MRGAILPLLNTLSWRGAFTFLCLRCTLPRIIIYFFFSFWSLIERVRYFPWWATVRQIVRRRATVNLLPSGCIGQHDIVSGIWSCKWLTWQTLHYKVVCLSLFSEWILLFQLCLLFRDPPNLVAARCLTVFNTAIAGLNFSLGNRCRRFSGLPFGAFRWSYPYLRCRTAYTNNNGRTSITQGRSSNWAESPWRKYSFASELHESVSLPALQTRSSLIDTLVLTSSLWRPPDVSFQSCLHGGYMG